MVNRETKSIMLVFIAMFSGSAAVFGVLLARAVPGDFETSFSYAPWWVFFIITFLCGMTAGLRHLAATATADAVRRSRLMKWHAWWWVAAVPPLAVSFWIFWGQADISWIWIAAYAAVIGSMLIAERRRS